MNAVTNRVSREAPGADASRQGFARVRESQRHAMNKRKRCPWCRIDPQYRTCMKANIIATPQAKSTAMAGFARRIKSAQPPMTAAPRTRTRLDRTKFEFQKCTPGSGTGTYDVHIDDSVLAMAIGARSIAALGNAVSAGGIIDSALRAAPVAMIVPAPSSAPVVVVASRSRRYAQPTYGASATPSRTP